MNSKLNIVLLGCGILTGMLMNCADAADSDPQPIPNTDTSTERYRGDCGNTGETPCYLCRSLDSTTDWKTAQNLWGGGCALASRLVSSENHYDTYEYAGVKWVKSAQIVNGDQYENFCLNVKGAGPIGNDFVAGYLQIKGFPRLTNINCVEGAF